MYFDFEIKKILSYINLYFTLKSIISIVRLYYLIFPESDFRRDTTVPLIFIRKREDESKCALFKLIDRWQV